MKDLINLSKGCPHPRQRILYQGNLGLIEANFIGFSDYKNKIGLVRLDNGNIDKFDQWEPLPASPTE